MQRGDEHGWQRSREILLWLRSEPGSDTWCFSCDRHSIQCVWIQVYPDTERDRDRYLGDHADRFVLLFLDQEISHAGRHPLRRRYGLAGARASMIRHSAIVPQLH